jgi:hypothetical protein
MGFRRHHPNEFAGAGERHMPLGARCPGGAGDRTTYADVQ